MPTSSNRRAGRPATAVLTKERILAAAFRVARGGPDAHFTMAALADALGVRPSAIYHHFPNRLAIVRAMRADITRQIDSTAFDDQPIVDAFCAWGEHYRTALLHAPDSIVLLATMPIDEDEASIDEYERITLRLIDEGWPQDRIVHTIVAIESFIIGSALDALAPVDNMAAGPLAEVAPAYSAAEAVRRAASDRPADVTFSIGLRALATGLRDWALQARGD